jgi:hypothetical protein
LRMPQKVKHGVVVCPRNSTPKYISKEKWEHPWLQNYTWMFIIALFVSAKMWKQPSCPSADEGQTKCGLSTQQNIIHIILLHETAGWTCKKPDMKAVYRVCNFTYIHTQELDGGEGYTDCECRKNFWLVHSQNK